MLETLISEQLCQSLPWVIKQKQINAMIKEGALIEDIDLQKALRELDGEKPNLKIYKQKEAIWLHI